MTELTDKWYQDIQASPLLSGAWRIICCGTSLDLPIFRLLWRDRFAHWSGLTLCHSHLSDLLRSGIIWLWSPTKRTYLASNSLPEYWASHLLHFKDSLSCRASPSQSLYLCFSYFLILIRHESCPLLTQLAVCSWVCGQHGHYLQTDHCDDVKNLNCDNPLHDNVIKICVIKIEQELFRYDGKRPLVRGMLSSSEQLSSTLWSIHYLHCRRAAVDSLQVYQLPPIELLSRPIRVHNKNSSLGMWQKLGCDKNGSWHWWQWLEINFDMAVV